MALLLFMTGVLFHISFVSPILHFLTVQLKKKELNRYYTCIAAVCISFHRGVFHFLTSTWTLLPCFPPQPQTVQFFVFPLSLYDRQIEPGLRIDANTNANTLTFKPQGYHPRCLSVDCAISSLLLRWSEIVG